MAVLAGELDGGFVGFRTGVAEEDAVRAAVVPNPARQLLLLGDPIQVGDVLQLAQLMLERLAHHTAAVAEGADRNAGHGIEIAAS